MVDMEVSVKAMLFNSDEKILALRRSETDPGRPLTWDFPGGQVDEGESLEESMRREILEETGLQVSELRVRDAYASYNKQKQYWTMICYEGHVVGGNITLSYEHDTYEWLTKEEFLVRESSDKIQYFLRGL